WFGPPMGYGTRGATSAVRVPVARHRCPFAHRTSGGALQPSCPTFPLPALVISGPVLPLESRNPLVAFLMRLYITALAMIVPPQSCSVVPTPPLVIISAMMSIIADILSSLLEPCSVLSGCRPVVPSVLISSVLTCPLAGICP
ncbi:hypothetical protein ACLOJK_006457, partial [Asimina triloba]